MKKLQRPFNVFKKHLLEHHSLIIHCDVGLYEQEKNVFCFSYFFDAGRKVISGHINVHQKEIVYEVSDYKRTPGKGFNAFSLINTKFEQLTY